ncbi:hypothetical protein Tco_1457853 [Tanacetum coccineum]
MIAKGITTRSGVVLDGPLPPMPPPYVNPDNEKAKENEVTKDKVQPESSQSTANIPTLGPFLRTARTLIDVFGEEMSLRTDEERLIISVRSEELKYTTRPHKESVCMIDIFSSPKERKWAPTEFVKDNDEINHEVVKR